MTSELTPGEVRAAAEVHRELGAEYGDAVIESFLDRVDRRVAERVDREVAARLGPPPRQDLVPPVQPNSRLILLTGVAIGVFVTGLPSVMVAASKGAVTAKDETTLLVLIGLLLGIVAAVAAFRATARELRRRDGQAKRA
jgi:hypothetical protein